MALLLKTFLLLSRRALEGAYRNGALGYSKAAAYSAILSFFPFLTTVATILVEAKAEFVSETIYNFLSEVLPPGTEDLVFYYFAIKGSQPVLLPVTGMIVSIWAASGAMASIMEGFRAAYRIPAGRTFYHDRAIAVLLVFSAAIPVLVASALLLLGNKVERWIGIGLGLLPVNANVTGWVSVVSGIARYTSALVAITLGAAILYRFAPNRPQKWKYVWPGALVATMLWFGATIAFAWYARDIANYNVVYGSIAAVIALLVWMYLLAVIAFIGCEFNVQFEKYRRG